MLAAALGRVRGAWVATIQPPSALAVAGGAAPCAFAPPLLLCVSALAFLPPPRCDRLTRFARLRGGSGLRPLRTSRMELPSTDNKRSKLDPDSKARKGDDGDATVVGLELTLTPEEAALFELLMKVVQKRELPCVLRVAGGWVRDKIMGKEAHDIDIAIDTMMGQEFTQHLVDYMKGEGREKEVGGVGVIKSNPDQSKHLETATLRVMGFELDFVNLRAEEYTDSRIPVMRIGTALEDAMRRDLTINALFYNINKRTVEDFTGNGMQDLKDGLVRTPLAPNQTMIDDPLRALRTVRFACRLQFQLEPVLAATLASQEVREALAVKVSKERVLTELNGMLLGPDPARALELLHSASLLGTVFDTPASGIMAADTSSPVALDPLWTDTAIALVRQTVALSPQVVKELLRSEMAEPLVQVLPREWTRLLYLTTMLSPLKDYHIASKKKPVALVEHVMRVSLKGNVKDSQDILVLLDSAQVLLSLSAAVASKEGGEEGEMARKVRAGQCLRKAGERWKIALVLATVQALAMGGDKGSVEGQFQVLEKKIIDDWCLENCWQMKPVLDGGKVCQILNLDKKKPEDGIKIGVITREMIDWQLSQAKPLQISVEQCESWLIKTHSSS